MYMYKHVKHNYTYMYNVHVHTPWLFFLLLCCQHQSLLTKRSHGEAIGVGEGEGMMSARVVKLHLHH